MLLIDEHVLGVYWVELLEQVENDLNVHRPTGIDVQHEESWIYLVPGMDAGVGGIEKDIAGESTVADHVGVDGARWG